MSETTSVRLQGWLDQANAGHSEAKEQLIAHACDRLRELARRMLRRNYSRLREVLETDDVLQNALVRLHRALQDPGVQVTSVADFLRLATVQIRRELIDLTRHHFGPARPRRIASLEGPAEKADTGEGVHQDPEETTHRPDRLLVWREFHSQVEALPEEERTVFELLWYQELTQAEAAEMLRVSVPTVKRRWLSARLLLQQTLQNSELDW